LDKTFTVGTPVSGKHFLNPLGIEQIITLQIEFNMHQLIIAPEQPSINTKGRYNLIHRAAKAA
jgi:hypothetical protein